MKNIISAVSMLLVFVFLVSSNNLVFAAWDGYTETEVANDVEVLVNMNDIGAITGAGLEISGTHTGKAVYSAHWRNHPSKTICSFPVSKDCSDMDKIIMPVYSEKATGAKIFVMLRCQNITPLAAGKNAYFEITFNIDWTGWKTFEWTIDEFGKANSPDLSRPIDFRVATKWGDAVPHPESDLYFDSICYAREEGAESESAETDVNFYNAMKGSVAVYNYNRNVYVNNGVELMDPEDAKATVLTKGGVSMVPVMFFKKYLNVETTVNESEIIFDNKMVLSTDNKEYTVDGERKVFESAPFKQGDKIFVPLVECCHSLGIAAKNFGELSVVGNKNSIGFVETDEKIYNKAVELTTKRMLSPENVTDEDFAQARKNFRISLVGDEGLYDPDDKKVAARLKGIQNSALSSWNQMNRGDDVFALFGTTAVTTTGDMTTQYQHLQNMAYGYGSYGTSTYKNHQLKLDILYGLEWLYENLYGEDEINNTGWIDTTGYNWWDWFIGVPNKLMKVLLIMEPEIYQSDIDKYISPFTYFYATRYLGNEKAGDPADSQGRILVGTMLAILNKDLSLWNKIYDDYEYSLKFAKGDGIRKDYSYIDHGTLPLAGMYGTEVIYNRLATAMACLSGTAFEMSSKNKYNLARWTYNTFDPLYFNGTMTTRVMGRSPEEGVQKTVELVIGAINMLGSFGPDDDAKLKNIIKSQVDETNIDRIAGRMSPVQIAQLEEIINDNTVSGDREEQTRVFYESDMVVQHRKNYGAALVMSSERVANYECINGVNKTGWYQGDGVLYVYPTGDKSQFQYGSTFWQKANMYRLPGITEDSQERKVWSSSVRYLPEPSFVGGTSVGDYAVAAMDFEAYHHDVQETGTDEGSGGALPYHDNDLVAKKSWFMFDDEIVALGSGITSTKNSPVYTVVENRQLKKSAAQTNYNVLSVSATGDDGNIPDNVVDGNLETRWSCEGTENVNLVLELEKEEVIGYVGVAQFNGDAGRQATFDIDLSVDGENWVTMFSGNSSGTTTSVEYSQLSRYYSKSGYMAYIFVAQELFMDKHMRPDIEFINRLTEDALNTVTKNITMENIIIKHTMFPYYGRFLKSERRKKAYSALVNMSGNYHNLLAVPKLNTERYLRYCPLCAKEDRKVYGETYWHRSHQIIGVDICPVHYCGLQNSNALISGKASPRFVTAEEVINTNCECTVIANDTEKKLCRYISDVFSLDIDLQNSVMIGDYISFKLAGTKYMTGKLRDMRTLTEDYNRFYNTSTELWRIQKVLTNDDLKLKNICMLAMFLNIKADELCYPVLPETMPKLNRKKVYTEKKPGVRTKDWEEIDRETLPKVKKVIQDFMNTAARPRKISVYAVEKMLNLPSKQINRMPKCKTEILRHYESQLQFWAREAEWAVNIINADKQVLNWKKIRELTNMRKANLISCLPYMKDSIREEVENLM